MGIGDGAVTNVLSGMEVWSTPEVPSRVVVAFSLLQMSDDGNKRGKLGLGTREKELVGSRKSCCTLIRFLLSGCTLNTEAGIHSGENQNSWTTLLKFRMI